MSYLKKLTKEQQLKTKIEELYLKKKKSIEEIAKETNLPSEVVESLVKFFRLHKSKEIIEKTKKMRRDLKKKRTKEECLKEFRKLKKELGRTPMLLELDKLGKAGLKRDILKHWGCFSDFLKEGRFGKPRPKKGTKHPENFRRLASEAAINYYQNGKWSKSEIKVKNILDKMGLVEEIDYWHNFRLKSPLGGIFELDFYLPKWNLVIECDSFWHDLGESKAKDKLRDEWVREKLGCKTLRFEKFNQKGLAKIRKTLKKILMGKEIKVSKEKNNEVKRND